MTELTAPDSNDAAHEDGRKKCRRHRSARQFLRSTARQKSCCASVMSSAAATFLRIDLRSFSRFSCLA
ncbi:hypothetical protein [Burkholderia cepacia]|uniref:hypothetical protein n=1 Tax=Burkholderia cepacia TaxID=292 RepID=UPI001CF1A9D2|nr:hypothetical protein [Burkholderia cepacia]MCA8354260.1 hypothetical protein [Burkholderia cepacia]